MDSRKLKNEKLITKAPNFSLGILELELSL